MMAIVHRIHQAAPHPEDVSFDAGYSAGVACASKRFWTPVSVAETAARWLVEGRGSGPVLDIGSGAGKFCVVGALSTQGVFQGIEQRRWLVRAANAAADRAGVADRVHFRCGVLEEDFLLQFSAFYLFNPFGENLYDREYWLDASVELSARRFMRDVTIVERALARTALGARVVTYHGFGGEMPDGFTLVRSAPAGTDHLRLWVRTATPARRQSRSTEQGSDSSPRPAPP